MILSSGDMIAMIIALGGSLTMMILFWRENISLRNQLREYQEKK